MILIRLVLTLALTVWFGYCVVALIYKDKPTPAFLERLALSWGIGIGLLGLFMFTLSLSGMALHLITVSVPIFVFALLSSLYLFIKKIPVIDLPSLKNLISEVAGIVRNNNAWIILAEISLCLLIALTIFYVFFDALVKPIVNYDDLWRQGFIAKIIFTSGKVLTKTSLDAAGPHPFLNPISQAWIYMGIGTWNDALGKIVFPLCFTSLLFIFYGNLRRSLPRFSSLFFTYLLTSFPLIIYHAGTAYSDLMQTFYYSAGAIYLFQWMKSKEYPYLLSSALLFGIGNFVKQTGIPLWAAAAIVLFIYIVLEERKQTKAGTYFILFSTVVSAPWLFYQNSFLMREVVNLGGKILRVLSPSALIGSENVSAGNLPQTLPTLSDILYHLGRRMFTYADWQLLWFTFILVLLFYWRRIWNSELKYLLLLIIFNLVLIIYAFFSPGTYQFLVDGTLVQRIMMYQIPVVLYFLANISGRPEESAGRKPKPSKN